MKLSRYYFFSETSFKTFAETSEIDDTETTEFKIETKHYG